MKFVAFLRAINVGGRTVKMEELRTLFEALGISEVGTFIASGNVIFEAKSKDVDTLQRKIEAHLHKSLGYEVATFVRTAAEVSAVAQYKPFTEAALKAAGALNVAFLAAPLSDEMHKVLRGFKTDIDDFHVHAREIYWLCKKKQSESTFSNVRLEKALKIKTTFRGMNTVIRLAAKFDTAP